MGVFVASEAHALIADHAPSPEREAAVDYYLNLMSGVLVTHCYECKTPLTSADCPRCGKCRKLRCCCGACMCGYTGGDNGATQRRRLSGRPAPTNYPVGDSYDPDDDQDDEDEGYDRDQVYDAGLDPDDPDFGELGAEGTDPDEIDWESEDYERD